MTEYTLHFDRLGGDTGVGARSVAGETAAELAQAVHRHARGYLAGRRVDVRLSEEMLTGEIVSHGVTIGAFHLAPAVTPSAPPETTSDAVGHVRHGFTLDDVERIAWGVAASSDRWHRATPVGERHDHARYGIVVHLLAADAPPTDRDLYTAGLAEINRAVHSEFTAVGRTDTADERGEFGYLPQVARYWHQAVTNPVEERVLERLALAQVWPLLTDLQRGALATLASCGDYEQAATALGVKLSALDMRLAAGRRKVAAAWFEHETPPRRRRKDRRVATRSRLDSLGRSRITVSQLEEVRERRHRGELIREIAADFGITPQALGRLLLGINRPAPDLIGGAA
ncbi:hypothetical protein ACIRLA_22210 [Streptomyces sp. NPDC102364]|uniref:hypothetical protein n=1 Tax=Streptomyces sp. NPDC102364 TaxID=3366161 RepID=UPI00381CC374